MPSYFQAPAVAVPYLRSELLHVSSLNSIRENCASTMSVFDYVNDSRTTAELLQFRGIIKLEST